MNQFEISRTINASCEDIFAAWTIDNQLKQWWAPYGFELSIFKLDLSIGGVFHYKMATVDEYEMWGRFVYADFRKPNKLVFINSFSDQKGKVMRAPFSDEWPLEIRNELTIITAGKQSIVSIKVNPVCNSNRNTDFSGKHGIIGEWIRRNFRQTDRFPEKTLRSKLYLSIRTDNLQFN